MSDLIDLVISNTLYLIVTVCIVGSMVYFGMKKMSKLFIIALIALVAFLGYVYYTGESVEDSVDKAGEMVK